MTRGQRSVHGKTRGSLFLFLSTLLVTAFAYLLSACAGLPVPDRPGSPELPAEPGPLVETALFRAYPARWYGNSQAACSITFDDGTLDQYLLAAPELDARGIRGTFFLITGPRADGYWQDGTVNRLLFNWHEARELQARGHEMASHTANHIDLRAYPHLAETEISTAHEALRRELGIEQLFSLGWPYWRSSPAASEQARRFHHAARAGGIKADTGSPHLGGVNGKSPEDYMLIGSRAILSTDTMEKLAPVFDEVHRNGGWLVPSFHGVDNGLVPITALGWEALELAAFRSLLDGLESYGFWFAPFGEVARYAMQRDGLKLEIMPDGDGQRIRYSSTLDKSIFDHTLTLVIEVPAEYRLVALVHESRGVPLAFHLEGHTSLRRYLVDLPPGDGVLLIQTCQESLQTACISGILEGYGTDQRRP